MARVAFSRILDLSSPAIVLAGLGSVAALSIQALGSEMRIALEAVLVVVWCLYILQLALTLVNHGWGGRRAILSILAVDVLAVAVPAAGFALSADRRDLGIYCGIWALKLLRQSATFRLLINVLALEARNLLGVLWIFGIILFSSALLAYLLERDNQAETFGSIPKAMWWSVVTLTTTGYGDAIPQTYGGRMLAVAVMISGIGIIALWTGILVTGFTEEMRRQDFVRRWELVAGVPLFQRLGSSELIEIVRCLRPRNLPRGAVICRKGEPGDQMYFILEGRVSVAAATAMELGPGTFIGEIALVTGEPRTATVTAATAVSLLALHASDFRLLIARSPELAETIKRTAHERRQATVGT